MSFAEPRRHSGGGRSEVPPTGAPPCGLPASGGPWTAASQPSLSFFLEKMCCFESGSREKILKTLNLKTVDDLILCCTEPLSRPHEGEACSDRLRACINDLKAFVAQEQEKNTTRRRPTRGRPPEGPSSSCSLQDSRSSRSSRDAFLCLSTDCSPQSSQEGGGAPSTQGPPQGAPRRSFEARLKSIDVSWLAAGPPFASIGLGKEETERLVEKLLEFILRYLTEMQFLMLRVSCALGFRV